MCSKIVNEFSLCFLWFVHDCSGIFCFFQRLCNDFAWFSTMFHDFQRFVNEVFKALSMNFPDVSIFSKMFQRCSMICHWCFIDVSMIFRRVFKGCSRVVQGLFNDFQWFSIIVNDVSMTCPWFSWFPRKGRRKEGRKEGRKERRKERKKERTKERMKERKKENWKTLWCSDTLWCPETCMVLRNAPKSVIVLRNAMVQAHPEKRHGAQKRSRPHTHIHAHTHTRTHTFPQVHVGIGFDCVWEHAKPV